MKAPQSSSMSRSHVAAVIALSVAAVLVVVGCFVYVSASLAAPSDREQEMKQQNEYDHNQIRFCSYDVAAMEDIPESPEGILSCRWRITGEVVYIYDSDSVIAVSIDEDSTFSEYLHDVVYLDSTEINSDIQSFQKGNRVEIAFLPSPSKGLIGSSEVRLL